MKLRLRPSGLRCAYCHDDMGSPSWSCGRCATRLHDDCNELLAGRCPTLGCVDRPRLVLQLVGERPPGASIWHLGAWLVSYAAPWVLLGWVSHQRFLVRARQLPPLTAAVVDLARVASTGAGRVVGVAVLFAIVAGYVVWRRRPVARSMLVGLMGLVVGFLAVVVLGVIQRLATLAIV